MRVPDTVGGGYIAVEFAQIFAGYGSKVRHHLYCFIAVVGNTIVGIVRNLCSRWRRGRAGFFLGGARERERYKRYIAIHEPYCIRNTTL